ncbi:MAG: hypothetical protein LBT09_06770 [Planctomycetaceae bacterium]|jgi:hypothetical protein|nr:hypothetical protein [Planctomycetaceae bacterium]
MNKELPTQNPLRDTNNYYVDLPDIIGIPFRACPVWTSFWHSQPTGVFTEKNQISFLDVSERQKSS